MPPKTSHSAADRKPANTTSAGARANTMASAKRTSAVRYSGIALVAKRPMVSRIRPRIAGALPSPGPKAAMPSARTAIARAIKCRAASCVLKLTEFD